MAYRRSGNRRSSSGRTSRTYSSSRSSARGSSYSSRSSSSTAVQKRKRRRRRIKPLPIVILVLIIAVICLSAFSKNSVQVFVDGTSVGYVKGSAKKITAEDLESTLTSQLSQQIGTDVRINEEITAKAAHSSKKNMVTTDSIISKLKENVTYKVKAAIITVDGEEIGVLGSVSEAEEFFRSFAAQYTDEESNLSEWEFTRDVKATESYVDQDRIVTSDVIRAKLTETRLEPVSYFVQSGDTLYSVATKLGTTYKQMMADNPELPATLYVGQELNILLPVPYVSVRTIEEIVETEVIPKGLDQQVDDSKSSDYKKIVQQGSDGERKKITQITKVNGVFESEEVVSDSITVQPVDDIIVVGR